ncbi:hypothetical protein N658DRAFT_464214 [Parathielavia hyrcaniae]|uniref:Uncharacterized protein n=1 Tax=Parathielavia hyrcaniae TaxID=113614 RepID=A0AAN6T480_9PEZI|nr:hypothetical protein N658DRAFT_464214 [Parathielavia hyrcaniae]
MGLPATPAASRYLTSKKPSTQKPQSQTPNAQYVRGPSQFNATPRFSATPRPSSAQPAPAFTTPALAIKSRALKNRSTQDVIDDSSPVLPEDGSPSASPTARDALPEPIEFDSSLAPQSPSSSEVEEGRSPKRRRISIASSEPETYSIEPSQQSQEADLGSLPDAPDHGIAGYHPDVDVSEIDVDDDGNDDEEDEVGTNISSSQSISSSPTRHLYLPRAPTNDPSDPEDFNAEPDTANSESPINKSTNNHNRNHNHLSHSSKLTTFHHIPRFKPTEPPDRLPDYPDTNAYYLLTADIFSPQRRGTKYLPGGLAAELRDWLVDVKGGVDGEGEVAATCSALKFTSSSSSCSATGNVAGTARIVVEDVSRGGPGMTLVAGRQVPVMEDEGEGAEFGGRVNVILAGEGNIEGLGGGGKGGGNRGRVVPGAVVTLVPPAWDVMLDGLWAVAYRWEAVKGVDGGLGEGGHGVMSGV